MNTRHGGAAWIALLIVAALAWGDPRDAGSVTRASLGILSLSAAAAALSSLLIGMMRKRLLRQAEPIPPPPESTAQIQPAIFGIELGADDRITRVSTALARMSGPLGSDLVGRRPEDLPVSTVAGTAARFAAKHRGRSAECEVTLSSSIGARRYRVSTSVDSHDLERASQLAIVIDLSQMHRDVPDAHERLPDAGRVLQLMHALAEASEDQILIVDPAMRVIVFNDACRHMFANRYGASLQEGTYLDDVLTQAGPVGEQVIYEWSRVLGGEEFTETVVEAEGRRQRQLETTYTPLKDAGGVIIGAAAVSRDVTEMRSVENQLRQSQKLEAVGQLTGGIAHEINNLLTVINATSDMLREPLAGAGVEIRRDLEAIRAASGRGTTLIRKLLSFSRRQPLEIRAIDLSAIVYELSDVLSRILPEHVTVDTRVQPPISAVLGDAGAVEQIVINLATNARDAMPDGGRFSLLVHDAVLDTAFCATRPGATPGKYVCIAVTDTGVGMDEDTLSMVFQPFFTTKPRGAGTGLGMSMIYGLVKQQRGYVDIESERGIGTTVRIYLPGTRQQQEAPAPLTPPAPRVHRGTETILLVEDQSDLRRAGQRILEKFGYRVLLAADGEEAIEVYQQYGQEIDLIVTDVIMPRLGGKQLYERIGRQEGAPAFLFTSGYSAEDLQRDGLLESGQPLLNKPWSLEEFVSRVQGALAPNGQTADGAGSRESEPDGEGLVNSGRFRRLT